MKISIIGYGTFGGAIASRLKANNHEVLVDEVIGSDVIMVATPSYRVKEALLAHKDKIKNQKIIVCSKGFSENGDLISNVLSKEFSNSIYFLYGPTLADGLTNGDFSAMVLAGGVGKEELKKAIESQNLYVELSDDVIGVQVGATLKNVVSVFIGIAEGMGLGYNTCAFIYTKGLSEIQKFGVSIGAHPETFLGLTCAGDLYLKSRNRTIGIEMGKGRKLEDLINESSYPKEGIATLKNLKNISKHLHADMRFFNIIHSVVFENLDVSEAVEKIAKLHEAHNRKRKNLLDGIINILNTTISHIKEDVRK